MKFVSNKYSSADILRKVRMDLNLTQKEFAKAVGITEATIKNYEQGRRSFSLEKLIDFCNKLNIDVTLEISTRKK